MNEEENEKFKQLEPRKSSIFECTVFSVQTDRKRGSVEGTPF